MFFRFASAAAFAAAASMSATPLAAAELPSTRAPASVETAGVFDADAVNAGQYRRWHRRDRVDAGDVIGGLLVIGTIAAVASAASKASQRNRDRDYRTQGYPHPSPDYRYDYRNRPYDGGMDDSRGLSRAVDMCAREVERNARIETVDSANRTGNGWDVSGRLRTGETFRCSIGNDGRIDDVDYGQGVGFRGDASDAPVPAPGSGQWDDSDYAAARAQQDGAPTYPGGPLPGDAEPSDDDRYETAQAPDFPG